jgi:branched-chain amino acid transport system permease protein
VPSLEFLKLFVVTGLALGGVYALSGVGIVVLYRATGVLNLAFGAVGALGAFISWELVNNTGVPDWIAYLTCIVVATAVTFVYGVIFGPLLAARDSLVKAIGTLGLALILLGIMSWKWGQIAGLSLILPTTTESYTLPRGFGVVNWTQIIGLTFGVAVTAGTAVFLRATKLGTAMRALADDREITATLGVPVRRVEAVAWLGSGLMCGISGLLLSNLLGLDIVTLTFFVISALAAALIARLQSLWVTLAAAMVIGLVTALLTPFSGDLQALSDFRTMTPFVFAIVALLWLGRHRVVTVTRVAR